MPGIKCGVVGLGPIGRDFARLALGHPDFELCAAIDVAEELVGQDVGELLGVENSPEVEVTSSLLQTSAASELDIVLHATGSRLENVGEQLKEILDSGINVLSTCEELIYPWERNRNAGALLHKCAMNSGSTLVGAGVNPGFAMDQLPLFLASATGRVDRIEVIRRTDIGSRRVPLQEKLGVGITESEFWSRQRAGNIGHVGLEESLSLLANALGWNLTPNEVQMTPVLSSETTSAARPNGRVLGVNHIARGVAQDGREIRLTLEMFAGADSCDIVRVYGEPDIQMVIPGGFSGDQCTTAVVFNLAPAVVEAQAGLLTVSELRRMRTLPCGTALRPG